jgi:hypothetical protein
MHSDDCVSELVKQATSYAYAFCYTVAKQSSFTREHQESEGIEQILYILGSSLAVDLTMN